MRIRIKKGLNIPIAGGPEQIVTDAATVNSVAVLGSDIIGIRPTVAVAIGDKVALGQTLFTDKANPGVRFTSPGAGEVTEINRGARRALQSVVVALDGDAAAEFESFSPQALAQLDASVVRRILLSSGLWTALRTRPFSRIPSPDTQPAAVFVTAIDTNPLAPDPSVVLLDNIESFNQGLQVLARLTDGPVYICTAPQSQIANSDSGNLRYVEFSGPHPAGLVGTHIHRLAPVSEHKTVWHLGYQDVVAIGRLFTSGKLPTERIVSIGGPMASNPRLVRTRVGASIANILDGETTKGRLRIVSGSVLSGHRVAGPLAWLGRYHNQISVLTEGENREFLAWMRPGMKKYSAIRAYAAHLLHRGRFDLTTTQNGSPRAMVSIGTFEKVMPLDILATPLLKALLVEDTEKARNLGCLELDEEDLALCSFVCNGKYEYGSFLRMNLDEIEANG